jgi:large repetitive protein
VRFLCRGLLAVVAAVTLLHSTPTGARAQQVQAVPGPSDLRATAVSSSRIDLNWTRANSGQVAQYRVYYANGTLLDVLPASADTYSDTGLEPWTEYRYYITGANSSGNESPPSEVASARTLDGTPPSAPGNLGGTATSSTRVSLNWSAATDAESGIDEYVVYRNGGEAGRTSGLTYQDSGLTPDTEYGYQVSAVNGQGIEGNRSGTVQVRTLAPPPPGPPRDLSATAVSASAIDLDWRAPAEAGDVASYRVYRDGSPVATVSATGYRDTGLASYTSYEYRVRSVNGDGLESAPSNSASARTRDGSPPTAPGGLEGTASSSSQISLVWSAASDPQTGISEYVIYRDGTEVGRTGARTYEDGALESDRVYVYEVSAVNGQGNEGGRAGPLEVRTLSDAAPDPPTGLTASAVDGTSVDLAWDPHPDHEDLDAYRIYRDGLFVADTRQTSFRDTDLTPFTTYTYTVTAVAGDGDESSPSAPAIVTTPDPTPPTVPEDLLATAVGRERIDLTWSPSSDGESGVSGYRVVRGGAEVAFTETASYSDAGLSPGTAYEYRVRAVNGSGLESGPSEPASATTFDEPGPPAPLDLAANPGGPTRIVLTWTAPAEDITGYNIYRDGAFVGSVTSTTFVDTGLTPETTYGYAVASLAGDTQGERTSEVFATTPSGEDTTPPAPPTGLRLATP